MILKQLPNFFFLTGIVILLVNLLVLLTGHQGLALKLSQFVYIFFAIGTVFYILKLRKNEKE